MQILGAYVQPCPDATRIYNHTVTRVITSGKIPIPLFAKLVPRQTPDAMRQILMKELEKFRK